jgi:DNA repair protein RadC
MPSRRGVAQTVKPSSQGWRCKKAAAEEEAKSPIWRNARSAVGRCGVPAFLRVGARFISDCCPSAVCCQLEKGGTKMSKEDWQRRVTGHRERLRHKFLTYGLEKLTDEEIVELLLTLGTPRRDCKRIARDALHRFAGLAGVLEASLDKLQQVPGIGPKNALGLKLVHEVARRFLKARLKGREFISSSREVYDYLLHSLRDLKKEVFEVIYLNGRNEVIQVETLFEGSLTSSAVYPREVIKNALDHHAVAMVFAHNHPSGDPAPSTQDFAITRDLFLAGKIMGIQVLDHLIIGRNRYYSFADQGHIRNWETAYGSGPEIILKTLGEDVS